MALAKQVGFTNNRYLKNEKDLFEFELGKVLKEEYGEEKLSLKNYSLQTCPFTKQMIIANYSLDPNQRTVNVPSLINEKEFSNHVGGLLQSAHNKVKEHLKEKKKSTK